MPSLIYIVVIISTVILAGVAFLIHFNEKKWVVAPWIGIISIVNITYFMSLGKIPMSKILFKIPFLNGATFTIFVLIFIMIVSLVFSKKILIHFSRKLFWKQVLLGILLIISTLILSLTISHQPISESIILHAESIRETSIVTEMMTSTNIQNMNWQAGIPLFIAFFSEIVHLPLHEVTVIIQNIMIVFTSLIIAQLLLSLAKLKSNGSLVITTIAVTICISLLSHIYPISLPTLYMVGLAALLGELTHQYITQTNLNNQPIVSSEEFVIATLFVTSAAINSSFLKVLIAVFTVIMMSNYFLNTKNKSLAWLKIFAIMILFNPLLISFAFQY